jgi:hypothetical protein
VRYELEILEPWRPVDGWPADAELRDGALSLRFVAEGGGPGDPVFRLPVEVRPDELPYTYRAARGYEQGGAPPYYEEWTVDEDGYFFLTAQAWGEEALKLLYG